MNSTRIFAMGGIEEVGKNMYVVEYDDEIIIMDAGIKFANELLLGMNGIIPSYEYLIQNNDKNIYLVITHGHEDHIGGVPYLLSKVEIKKIYAPALAMEMIKRKMNEFKLSMPDHEVINENSNVTLKNIKLDFFRVCHSVPDSFGVLIETPNGNIVNPGDYRFDFCSDEQTDIVKIGKISEKDIDILFIDTTNAEAEGFSNSEIHVIENLLKIIKDAKGRVFISTFSSNLSRIEKVIEGAVKLGRKICIIGRSMENNIKTAKKIGLLNASESDFISSKEIDSYNDSELLFILTGSQGEEKAALNQIALGIHPKIIVNENDTFVLSSNPIPGNFLSVEELVNRLFKTGAKVIQHKIDSIIHASGHATTQEQQLMIKLVNPQYIVPVHGEYKMLKTLRKTAMEAEFHKDNVIIIKNGEVIELKNKIATKTDEIINVNPVLIDGKRISKNSIKTIEERKEISDNGVFNIIICIDKKNSKIVGNPQISTRGIFFVKDSISLIQKISYSIKEEIEKLLNQNKMDNNEIKKISNETSKFYIWKNKKKNPKIITTIFEI